MLLYQVLIVIAVAGTFAASQATNRYSYFYGRQRYQSCRDVRGPSGSYTIYPNRIGSGIGVYCDMTTDGGGWTVFQRRKDGSENFYRDWDDYKNGFGSMAGEFWLGLKHMRTIMKSNSFELRIDMETWEGRTGWAKYSTFKVGCECVGYRLNVGGFSSSHSKLGDSMAWHNNQKFSTKDKDNDSATTKCALRHKGGWWYNECRHSNLNGLYRGNSINGGKYTSIWANGIDWFHWNHAGPWYSLKRTEMKFR